MCRFNLQITIYKCGAVEQVETKVQDCKRMECINSKKHPWRCTRTLTDLWKKKQSKDHAPACREYHETTFTFANKVTCPCPGKNCQFVQNQDDPYFRAAVSALQEEVQKTISEQQRLEHDAASTLQLRDEPM